MRLAVKSLAYSNHRQQVLTPLLQFRCPPDQSPVAIRQSLPFKEERDMEAAMQRTKWLGKSWKFLEVTTSTQDEAKKWVREGAPHGALVVAEEQTRGRGRLGRSWFSPPRKNLYFTVALKLPTSSPPLSTLSLLAGIAVAEALRSHFNAQVFVKWANDVVGCDGRKLAGILVEGFKDCSGTDWALIGIGVNVNLTEDELPNELREIATSLQILLGRQLERFQVLGTILASLEAWWEDWAEGMLEKVLKAFEALDWLKGKLVRLTLPDGAVFEGVATGVTEEGHLRLKLSGDLERDFPAGEATVRVRG
jgi:BirA family transcriptional regulator, biotin operon repressor / biotin---[acetyl-CoA-carboxylase] ligase